MTMRTLHHAFLHRFSIILRAARTIQRGNTSTKQPMSSTRDWSALRSEDGAWVQNGFRGNTFHDHYNNLNRLVLLRCLIECARKPDVFVIQFQLRFAKRNLISECCTAEVCTITIACGARA